jgi:enamine deaminase RidA (YjgF/YER057c/UK114 family)
MMFLEKPMSVEYINPPGLSKGAYSHVAVVNSGRMIFISGQVATDPSGHIVGTTFSEQATQVFENLKIALAASGATFSNIVKMNSYVRDLTGARVKTLREVRIKYLGDHLPASTLVATPGLVHEDMMLEVEVVAVV